MAPLSGLSDAVVSVPCASEDGLVTVNALAAKQSIPRTKLVAYGIGRNR